MKYFYATVLFFLAVMILQRQRAVADEHDGRYTVVERSLDDELALLLADNAEFDANYIGDYSIDLSEYIEDNWENNEFDDSLDMYEDEYDNERRAVNETTTSFDDYEDDGDTQDYYELPLQSATVGNNERHLAADCNSENNEQYFKLVLKTDNYGFEESWTLMKRDDEDDTGGAWVMVATGPEEDTIYKDNKTYIGGYCLSVGTYKFTINDKFKDGMCCENGIGGYIGYVNDKKQFSSPSGDSDWAQRVHEFSITSASSSNSNSTMLEAADDNIFGNYTTLAVPQTRGFTGGMTTRDQLWLVGHNKRRKTWHTRYGKRYVPLQWSNSLKAQASVYAKKLVRLCGGNLVHDNTQYGENLASNAGNGKWGTIRHPEKIMIRWVEKEANVGWPANAHLTQALWRATKFVGCYEHATRYKNGKGMCHIQVCRYAKPGNCNMGAYTNLRGNARWLTPMLKDDSKCGPSRPP